MCAAVGQCFIKVNLSPVIRDILELRTSVAILIKSRKIMKEELSQISPSHGVRDMFVAVEGLAGNYENPT